MPDAVTLPRYFKDNGYYVLGGGKIFHEDFPDPGAWHEYVLAPTGGFNGDPVPPDRGENELMGPLFGVADTAMGDWKTASWMIEQLQRDFDRPFFMAGGIFRPHLPWFVPEAYFEPFPIEGIQLPNVPTDDLDDIPDAGLGMRRSWSVSTDDQRRSAVQAYLASVSFADSQLGRLLEALENSKYADNTIVVLWSDNGFHLGEKGNWRKFTLWEESTRVPLVFVVPERVVGLPRGAAPGARSSRPVNLVDVYPTLVELAGLPPKADLDGMSLVPLLKDPAMEWLPPSITTWGRSNHAVRSERYRYIRYADGSEEFYDHQTDPDEFANLAWDDAYAEIISEHRRWIPEVNAPNAKNRPQGLWNRLKRLLRL
jgi:arylsulfatase A-like enzyme